MFYIWAVQLLCRLDHTAGHTSKGCMSTSHSKMNHGPPRLHTVWTPPPQPKQALPLTTACAPTCFPTSALHVCSAPGHPQLPWLCFAVLPYSLWQGQAAQAGRGREILEIPAPVGARAIGRERSSREGAWRHNLTNSLAGHKFKNPTLHHY